MILRFEEVSRARKVSFRCNVCAKPRTRTVRVTHTVNPYNRNPDGSVRTRGEVTDCVREELDRLCCAIVTCVGCEKARRSAP